MPPFIASPFDVVRLAKVALRLAAASLFVWFGPARVASNEPAVADDASSRATSKNVLVVAPPVFDAALRPWIAYRESQGYSVDVLSLAAGENGSVDLGIQTKPVATPKEIRAKIQAFAREKELAAILLVGDGAPTVDAKFGWRDVVPAARRSALVVQAFGSEESLATDSYYSDLDDDGVPDVPIGRIPAETPEELTAVVEKIVRYETASPSGNWTRKINIVAGPNGLDLSVVGSAPGSIPTPGANPLAGVSAFVDSVVDRLSQELFVAYLPQAFATSITRCSFKSAYCPYPPDFGRVFLERANEGALFLVYIGHGRVFGLDRATTPDGGDYGIFELEDCSALDSPKTAPIALFFACYTGAYDASYRSLAEEVALSPNGPVAALAASRRTAPYGTSVFGTSLLEGAFGSVDDSFASGSEATSPPLETLGEIVLFARRKTLTPPEEKSVDDEPEPEISFDDESSAASNKNSDAAETENGEQIGNGVGVRLDRLNARLAGELRKAEKKKKARSFRETLDRTAAIFDPTAARLPEQLEDHVAQFNLFGDPLLRVKFPQRISVDAPDITYSSKKIPISGEIPIVKGRQVVYQAELALADFRSPVARPDRDRRFVESPENRDEFRATYRGANEFVVDAVRGSSETGRFSTEIVVPADFSGEAIVRVAATDGERYYIGSKRVLVRPFNYRPGAAARSTAAALR